jgi:hypothetical protein
VIAYNPQPGQIVTSQPPAAVEEVPPTQKPEGNYLWIPGYWAFDQDRNHYIWVSGVWRIAPPGTAWVPGYWNQVANGYQWTSGYWAAASVATGATQETEYLPAPPQSLETGASSPQPTVDHFWIPGYWQWYGGRYAWRAGYWGRAQADWVWIPARYVWTPSGYVFIAGHWDYCMAQRGLAFCPVYFNTPLYTQTGYYYTPSVCIQTSVLNDYLFCRPAYCHYYFGDYYDPRYVSIGIYPWFSVGVRIGYEPCFVHDRWYYGRTDPRWEANLRVNYNYRVAHVDARPPRTWEASLRVGPGARVAVMGAPLNRVAVAGHVPFHMETVSAERREEYRKFGTQVRGVQTERRNMELRAQAEHRSGQANQSFRLKTPSASASANHGNYPAGRTNTSGGRTDYAHPGQQPGRVDTVRTYRPGTTTPSRDTRAAPAKGSERDKDKDHGGR